MGPASAVFLAAALVFDVGTHSPFRYTNDIKLDPPVFTLSYPSGGVTEVSGGITVSNYFGETMTLPVKTRIAAGETVRLPLDLVKLESGRTMGIWRARAVLAAGGSVSTNDTSFAHIPLNPVTPRIARGRFRLGMQYHMGRFPDDFQPMALDALAAMGCKLVRVGGFHAHPCWPEGADEPDFARAEKMMELLKRYGLSVNVFCWPNAKWMAEEKDQKRPYPAYIRSRPKKGLMGLYAEKLAARFGTDIDYIEPSNEPDFWGRDSMGIDDYIDYQREVYAGVKRGCKDILVLSPGWAVPDSSHPRIVHKGFQERLMAEAKDAYDVHAIHMHGMFPDYEKSIAERFFPLRKKCAVTAPWYANETAMTCINGAEDAVAGTLWKKILWSRAHGSVDYIWYNLIATGSDPKDPEQGFGMFTRSLKPRATFASFAALANLLRDLEFDGIVHEGKGRYLYRWRNLAGGARRIVLVGWDEHAETPMPVTVRSDAKAAAAADLMGNRTRLKRTKGRCRMQIGQLPSALVLEGASFAEADRKDVARASVPKKMSRTAKAKIKWRAPDFQLMVWWQVHEMYAANWETVDRTWKGPEDLSANIYVGSEGGNLCVYFEVKDDAKAPEDSVWISVEPPERNRKFEFKAYRRKDGREVRPGRVDYELKIPLSDIGFTEETLKKGFMFQAKVFDDDGLGKDFDFWMETRHCWVSIAFE